MWLIPLNLILVYAFTVFPQGIWFFIFTCFSCLNRQVAWPWMNGNLLNAANCVMTCTLSCTRNINTALKTATWSTERAITQGSMWFLILFAGLELCWAQYNPNTLPGRTSIVHLFEWRWNDIALECERYLAPNGFGGVQVGRFWWQHLGKISMSLAHFL